MTTLQVVSSDVEGAKLFDPLPLYLHLYTLPFLSLYPVLAYAYYVKYDTWLKSEEWTFLACVALGAGHALSFLITRWSIAMRARITCVPASDLATAKLVQVMPKLHRGKGEIVQLFHKPSPYDPSKMTHSFIYQKDHYTYQYATSTFAPIPYPVDSNPPLSDFQHSKGLTASAKPSPRSVPTLLEEYGKNICDIPIPRFTELFAEHAVAPFFVFQIFCVALWCLDEYWYYSIFTGFMLVVFECTVVFQRVRTLTEFRTMSVPPYMIGVFRDDAWTEVMSDDLVPGDLVSITRTKADSAIPCDVLLLSGTAIVNEAMLSGESTPLLKESIALREGADKLDMNGADRNSVLFSGTKALQVEAGKGENGKPAPDGGCLGVVLRTGFGTTQGQLVRTMLFSTEAVTAGNLESFIFIGFLLIFAIAASAYVWVNGLAKGMKKSKLLLDCVLIITSVVPPELPMELSMAVNASLAALSKYAIFCTEPFRIAIAGRVDVCCFDKTGTITGEDLVVEGIAGVHSSDPKQLVPIQECSKETTLTLATSHALVLLEDGTLVGDPMEKTTLEALGWQIGKGDLVTPKADHETPHKAEITMKRRYQFSSALKRMSTVSYVPEGKSKKTLVSVKGAPETLKTMYATVPDNYDETYKWFTRRGSRVLALGWKHMDNISANEINHLAREKVETGLQFAGFLVFHCPLKPDAVESLKMLSDSSHRCIMITGDNPLTAVHVAKEVEIVDRDVLILDVKEGTASDLVWKSVDDTITIDVDPTASFDQKLFDEYDICVTGVALKQFEERPSWIQLVQHTWVYARVSPSQKEFILTTFKNLGFTTLMAGDGTNDVGALKQAHIGVALLDGSMEDLKAIADHQKMERIKKVYEQQVSLSARFNQPPPPVPAAIRDQFPELVAAQQTAAANLQVARKKNPMERFDLGSITDKLADMDDGTEPPKIKLGDASCAAPFTSKLSNVSAITHIIRQGRCTLVATVQMYKILALNCLITAYSLSVQYLDGIKFGDYQHTITGMLMSVCFLCISRAKPIDKLSRERPLGNILNLYVLLSILIQFAIHIAALLYMTILAKSIETRGDIDLDASFEPCLLNTAIYLLGLSQQVSTFAINFQGRPFRESISENPPLYWGLLGVVAVAYNGSTDFFPEANRWLQLVDMTHSFKFTLTAVMLADFAGCAIVERVCKHLFADLAPKELVTRGSERRIKRREAEARALAEAVAEKKDQ